MNRKSWSVLASITFGATLIAGAFQSAAGKVLCVNPRGTKGCYAKIGQAVAAASPNDTIQVAAGLYKEDVIVGIPLSLIAANRGAVIDATGLPNGVYIDGMDNPGLVNVVVAGFTIRNANFEGILATNASSVTLLGNNVMENDKSLNPSGGVCPGLPPFETEEGFDCGEGIHLSGVDHSIVANNTSANNSGGILLSDDTAATHDILVTGNLVLNNPYDCGITLASHPPATGSSPFGVYHNTIISNVSNRNGLAVGGGAGIGIFDSVPGAANYQNVVSNNRLIGNGLPGVAMHSHTPGQTLTDNVIVGNFIMSNGPDSGDAQTPGPTGINVFGVSPATGTVVSQNTIVKESVDVAVKTPAAVDVHLNNLLGGGTGVDNLGGGTSSATENYWGCPAGPGAKGCSSAAGPGVLSAPWLVLRFIGGEF
ncbi:MAG: NosD domain-containing protein [Terriglobia bacterium]